MVTTHIFMSCTSFATIYRFCISSVKGIRGWHWWSPPYKQRAKEIPLELLLSLSYYYYSIAPANPKQDKIVSINIYIYSEIQKGCSFGTRLTYDLVHITGIWNVFYVNHNSKCIIVQKPKNNHHKIWNNPNI